MSKSPLIIANLKMNLSFEQTNNLIQEITVLNDFTRLIMAVSPPFLSYAANHYKQIKIAAQDVSIQDKEGPFTGEMSAAQLKSCSVNYAIIGHSERNDNLIQIKRKLINCLNVNITPIVCLGETVEARASGKYLEVIIKQLQFLLSNVHGEIIIAYEPIWAIGSGIYPTPDELNEIFKTIQSFITDNNIDIKYSLVYGGSVNLDNINQLWLIELISGFLVGNASLKAINLQEMLKKNR